MGAAAVEKKAAVAVVELSPPWLLRWWGRNACGGANWHRRCGNCLPDLTQQSAFWRTEELGAAC